MEECSVSFIEIQVFLHKEYAYAKIKSLFGKYLYPF
jgi:hypothetical protein